MLNTIGVHFVFDLADYCIDKREAAAPRCWGGRGVKCGRILPMNKERSTCVQK